jgi:SAM-dependent methyltransferase
VLDVGCWDYAFARLCREAGVTGLRHHGIDRERPTGVQAPADYIFTEADIEALPLPFSDESFDAVVASHVIEHVGRPHTLLAEIFRVLRIGGVVYLECPSTRSLYLPSMPFKFEEFRSLNFYDDPTHVGRPHSRQSLYRLFRMHHAEVLDCAHVASARMALTAPWHLARAWVRRDAALLEHVVWWAFGFAVYGVARKLASAPARYVLSGS